MMSAFTVEAVMDRESRRSERSTLFSPGLLYYVVFVLGWEGWEEKEENKKLEGCLGMIV